MNITKEEKKQEALKRLHVLADRFNLGSKLENYFDQDRLYYSYGCSMDTINYDESYAKSAKAFEKRYQCLVYHAVEAEIQFGKMLSFLYVSDTREDWSVEELTGKRSCPIPISLKMDGMKASLEISGWIHRWEIRSLISHTGFGEIFLRMVCRRFSSHSIREILCGWRK